MTLFKSLLQRTGMSQTDAADFLNVPVQRIKNWSAGRQDAPKGVLEDIRELLNHIFQQAETAISDWRSNELETSDHFTIFIHVDEHHMKERGWPCVSAQMMMAANIFENLPHATEIEIMEVGDE